VVLSQPPPLLLKLQLLHLLLKLQLLHLLLKLQPLLLHPLPLNLQNTKETLNKSFDRLRANGRHLIPFVASLLNHE